MSTIGNLVVNLLGNSAPLDKTLSKSAMSVTSWAGSIRNVIGGLSVAALASWGTSQAVQAEQAAIAFKTLLGSAQTAKQLLSDLSQFAQDTPYESPEVVTAAKQLLAFGVEAGDVIPTLRRLGDVASGVGSSIGDMAYLFGTAKTQGRLFSQDINQFTGRGVPIIKALAATMNVAEGDVKKLVEAGKVGFPQLEAALIHMTSAGSQFGGMMDEQSRSIGGRWSSVMDGVGKLLQRIAELFFEAFNVPESLQSALITLEKFQRFVDENRATLQNFATVLKYTAAAIGIVAGATLLYAGALRAVAIGQAIVQALSGPKGWLALGAGLLVATAAAAEISGRFDEVIASATKAADATQTVADPKMFEDSAAGVQKLIDRLRDLADMKAEQPGHGGLSDVLTSRTLAASPSLTLSAPLTEAQQEARKLNDVLAAIRGNSELLGDGLAEHYTAYFERQLAAVTGIDKELARVRAEAQRASGLSGDQQKLAEFGKAGASAGQIEELRAAQQFLADTKKEAESFAVAKQAINDLTRDIEQLQGASDSTAVALRDMIDKGLPANQIDKVRGLLDQKKNLELAKTQREALTREAESIAEAVKTPLEKTQEQLAKIGELRSAGLLTADVAQRAELQARQGGAGGGSQLSSALLAGSSEAVSAINRAQSSGASKNPNAKLESINQKVLEQMTKLVAQAEARQSFEAEPIEVAEF